MENNKYIKELQQLNELQNFTVRRMSLVHSTSPEHITVEYVKQYIATSPPQHFVDNKAAHVDASNL